MKIASINTSNYGSTGNIMLDVLKLAEERGHNVYSFCANARENKHKNVPHQFFIGFPKERGMNYICETYSGLSGCFGIIGTYKLLKKLNEINPDVLHLHNIHGWYINHPMLFRWIKKRKIKVIWTLHDCWAFTGHCPHFELIGCDKWKTGCHKCPQYNRYPKTKFDNSRIMYKLKKKWFTGVDDMTVVTPSKWLEKLVKESFLNVYNVKVINNGIDLSKFKPTESNLRQELGLENKYVLLGVASPWSDRKGLDVFVELSSRLSDEYKIVLVGLTKQQISELPDNIMGIERTSNQTELAQYYSMADLFVNPTKEEVLGLVNIEALSCGTPVVTFNSGGSPECIDKTTGVVVDKNDVSSMEKAIYDVVEDKLFNIDACVKRAVRFDKNNNYKEYINLYESYIN